MDKVLCSATVDLAQIGHNGGPALYEVTVWENPPSLHRIVYMLRGKCEDEVAQEGLRRFVEDITALREQQRRGH